MTFFQLSSPRTPGFSLRLLRRARRLHREPKVCIYQIPKGESVVTLRSPCGCGQPIAWYDNLPVLSWLILRGRARCCGRPFSFRYAFVELLTAAFFALSWHLFPAGKAVAGMVLVAIVICAFFIDLDHMIIPDVFTIGGAVAGVLLSLLLPDLHGHTETALRHLRSGLDGLLGVMPGSASVLGWPCWRRSC